MIFICVLCFAAVYTNIVSLPSETLAPSRQVVILVISTLDVQLDEPRAIVELIHHTTRYLLLYDLGINQHTDNCLSLCLNA